MFAVFYFAYTVLSFLQFLTACIASLEVLQITCGCSTDGPECECSREYEGQDAELEQAARSHLGSRVFLRVSDPAYLANHTSGYDHIRSKSLSLSKATGSASTSNYPCIRCVYVPN